MDDGITRPFAGKIEAWPYDPPNETEAIANIVREYVRQRAMAV
jgi:mitochondrial fission protein ELM1